MTRRKSAPTPPARSWLIRLAALLAFLVEIIFVQEAFSPFRTPKMLLATSSIAILCSLAVFSAAVRGRFRIHLGQPGAVLLALPVLQAASSLWAQTPIFSLRTAGTTAIWVFGTLALSTAADGDRRLILKWTIAGACLSGLVLLAQAAHIETFRLAAYTSTNRLGLAGLAGNPADYAIGALLLVPFLARDLFRKPRSIMLWVPTIILLLGALSSQNLTALLAVLLLGAWYLLRNSSRRTMIGVGLLGLSALTILMLSPVGQRLRHQVDHLEKGNWYALLSGREDGWSAAEMMVRNAPINGIGAGQFSREFYPARLSFLKAHHEAGGRGEMATHFEWAHNDILQMQAELGLIGTIWIIVFLWALLRTTKQRDLLLLPGAIVALPFLLLHYPTHITLGLLPIMLILAEVLQDVPVHEVQPRKPFPAILAAVILLAASVFLTGANISRLSLERWRGAAEGALDHLHEMPRPELRKVSEALEKQTAVQMLEHPHERHWLWRIVGRTRYARGSAREAEAAFRKAFSLFPHEEAEMGLGLSLAAQNRITEALYHLGRACRLNPTLLKLIPDQDLRQAVRREFRNRPGRSQGPGRDHDTRKKTDAGGI